MKQNVSFQNRGKMRIGARAALKAALSAISLLPASVAAYGQTQPLESPDSLYLEENADYTNFLSTNRGNIVCEPGRNLFVRANLSF